MTVPARHATDSTPQTLTIEALDALRAGLRGQLLLPTDAGYNTARAVWNGMIDKRPALIARCAGVADVRRAIAFGREHDLLVSIRGGGHSAAGHAVCDGGLMIDLSLLRSVHVDPRSQTARVEAGALWSDFDHETTAFGLVTTGGLISTTGIAGLTLGGGVGWLNGKYGLACDNLIAADVVTADGDVVHASAQEHSDLLWGLRGGGGNFGVVTSFEYQLHQMEQTVLTGMVVYPFTRARDAIRLHREITEKAPDELTVYCVLGSLPTGDRIVAYAFCYAGAIAEGERLVAPLRLLGEPLLDATSAMPYVTWQGALDEGEPAGLNVYWKSTGLREMSDDAIEAIVDQAAHNPSVMGGIAIEHYHGAYSRVAPEATAYHLRDMSCHFVIAAKWEHSGAADANISWARETYDRMHAFATGGTLVSFMSEGEQPDRLRTSFGPNYERLVGLKRTYDPTNVFRLNHNIDPAG